ncbi:MAG: DUF1499 domain-containing protein [Rhodobacteraceae bacterium]|nr:DUF1499 domain-containing protein [Paracoccaceae bacterium]
MKRYAAFVSPLARVSRMVGAVALPLLVLSILAHRSGFLVLEAMAFGILIASAIGILAILMALIAYSQLWHRGGKGAGSATWGIFYALLAVLPGLVFAYSLFSGTRALDVTTNRSDPPKLERLQEDEGQVLRSIREIQTWIKQPEVPEDIVPRRYRVDPGQLYVAAIKAAERSGWQLTRVLEPDMQDTESSFQAVVKTPILGLLEDVAVRIRPDRIGSFFDMRSASRHGITGLRDNADRIRAFYEELDGVLLETYGEIENIAVLDLDDPVQVSETPDPDEPVDALIPLPGFKPYIEDPKTEEELQAEAEALGLQDNLELDVEDALSEPPAVN